MARRWRTAITNTVISPAPRGRRTLRGSTRNPAPIVAEFGRVLRPGGLAVFAEPGPTHSRAPQSQFEMRSYGVVENDVDVHEIWRLARSSGFAELRMIVFHGLPFHVSLEQFEDFLRGGETCADWTADARVFLRNVRNFILVKKGQERDDSRSAAGLACEIHARPSSGPTVEGAPLPVNLTVTNVGRAVWLPRSAGHGGVSIGARIFDGDAALLSTDVVPTPLTDPVREIGPGETITVNVTLPPQRRGRYRVEIDCVAEGVG